jgi:superfamily II DNA/RNA helicase
MLCACAQAMDDFISESGKIRVLVCTDLLARGVGECVRARCCCGDNVHADVKNLTLVVNYDLPHVKETSEVDPVTYLHRIGRTGIQLICISKLLRW